MKPIEDWSEPTEAKKEWILTLYYEGYSSEAIADLLKAEHADVINALSDEFSETAKPQT